MPLDCQCRHLGKKAPATAAECAINAHSGARGIGPVAVELVTCGEQIGCLHRVHRSA